MLQWEGINIPYWGPHRKVLLWYRRQGKINVSVYCLIIRLCVNQVIVLLLKVLSKELRVNKGCVGAGQSSCHGLSNLYKTLSVRAHTIIREGFFFFLLSLPALSDSQLSHVTNRHEKVKAFKYDRFQTYFIFAAVFSLE